MVVSNNPVSVWIRSHIFHYRHAVCYGLALCDEYQFRFKRIHHCEEHLKWLKENEPNLPKEAENLRQPWCACPDKYKVKPPQKVEEEKKKEENEKEEKIELQESQTQEQAETSLDPQASQLESLMSEIQQRMGQTQQFKDETEYQIEDYVIETYQTYYCNEKLKVKMATWRECEVPEFVVQFREKIQKKNPKEAQEQQEDQDFEAEIELSKEIEKDIKKRKNTEKVSKKKKKMNEKIEKNS